MHMHPEFGFKFGSGHGESGFGSVSGVLVSANCEDRILFGSAAGAHAGVHARNRIRFSSSAQEPDSVSAPKNWVWFDFGTADRALACFQVALGLLAASGLHGHSKLTGAQCHTDTHGLFFWHENLCAWRHEHVP